jgi:acyl carrier protein
LTTVKSDVKEKLIMFLNEYFIKETGLVVKDDTSFLDEGIIDSTGVIELVTYIEIAFEIKVEDEEIIPDNLDSINKLVDFIHVKLEKKSHM